MYTNANQWRRVRSRVLVMGESIWSVAKREGMSRNTLRRLLRMSSPPQSKAGRDQSNRTRPAKPVRPSRKEHELQRWKDWLYALERGDAVDDQLASELSTRTGHERRMVLAAMAERQGFGRVAIATHLGLAKGTVSRHLAAFSVGGVPALLERKQRSKKADDPLFGAEIFKLLHEPPALSGYNRTTWRLEDLRAALAGRGISVSRGLVSQAIRKAGFRWRAAKVVLTSTDPEYREKLAHVQFVLSRLRQDERFFSIDEFGPFAVKAKAGRVLVGPDDHPSVPQWQQSKGWLILTAALELSQNRVTHFYSRAKNTGEMIRMAKLLLQEYRSMSTLYLSWDAASWHISKALVAFIEAHNAERGSLPRIELVPLPASAQFLNVIESVFSGMARAIIHSSDYASVTAARAAIDRYFDERNRYFADHPKRAGSKIWGQERTAPEFDAANNCKDAAYR